MIQIYEAVVVGKLSASEQTEYNELSALDGQPDLRSKRRNRLDALERHCMVSPGISVLKLRNVDIYGFKPLLDARGLFLANKQVSRELKDAHWSKNTFLVRVQEGHPFDTPERSFRDYVAPFAQRAKRLYIDIVTTTHHPGEPGFQHCVNIIKRQLHVIITSLNQESGGLDSLTVRYTSCFPGGIEDLRIDADGLAAHPQARVIWVMDPRTDKMRHLNHTEMKQLYLHSNAIADALCALKISVSKFSIFGDLSGLNLSRLSHKFSFSIPEVEETLDRYGQRLNELAEMSRAMAREHPDSADLYSDLIRSQEQIFSTRALTIRKVAMLGPPSWDPEYARLMALARSI